MDWIEEISVKEKLTLGLLLFGFTISGVLLVFGYRPILGYLKAYNFGLITVLVYSMLEDEGKIGTEFFQ